MDILEEHPDMALRKITFYSNYFKIRLFCSSKFLYVKTTFLQIGFEFTFSPYFGPAPFPALYCHCTMYRYRYSNSSNIRNMYSSWQPSDFSTVKSIFFKQLISAPDLQNNFCSTGSARLLDIEMDVYRYRYLLCWPSGWTRAPWCPSSPTWTIPGLETGQLVKSISQVA